MSGHLLQEQIALLYCDHHGWLNSWLRRRLGDVADAADLAQDTYLRLLNSGRLPPPDESRRHLVQIAKGLMIDLYRRRQVEAAYLESLADLPAASQPSEETRRLIIETLLELDALLQALAPKARAAFLLCRLEGLTYREIATRLEVSVSSVEKYIASALIACCRVMHD